MNKQYLKRLLVLAFPIILSNVISQIQMIIDKIFLGQMDSLYMSALGNVTSPVWTTMSFCFSISTGTAILISQCVGAGDEKNAESYAAAMLKWSNVIPFLLFVFWMFAGRGVFTFMGVSENVMPMCLGYMRWYAPSFLLVGFQSSFSVIMQTSNYTRPMVFYGAIRSGVNILLDWLLIFGNLGMPRMGIVGAAMATTIAEFIGCMFALIIICRKKLRTKPSLNNVLLAPVKPFFQSMKLGINAALEDFTWNIGNLVLIRILNSIDEKAAGIYSIVFGVEVLAVTIIGSFGNGTLVLTGESVGAKDKKQYVGITKLAFLLSALTALVMLVLSLAIPEQILGLFTSDQSIITGCGMYLSMVCLNLYGKSGNIIVGSAIKGSGDTKWMFYTQFFGMFLVIGSACLFVYGLGFGIMGVFMAVIVDEAMRAVINLGRLIYITKHWEY